MTRIRVSVVSRSALARVAAELGLADAIVVGESERGTGGRGLRSALENVYEASSPRSTSTPASMLHATGCLATLGPLISEDAAASLENPKSELQELLQARGETPVYRLVSQDGPPHARTFTVEVEVAGAAMGSGSGRTKKEAEAAAAAAALAQSREARDAPVVRRVPEHLIRACPVLH